MEEFSWEKLVIDTFYYIRVIMGMWCQQELGSLNDYMENATYTNCL